MEALLNYTEDRLKKFIAHTEDEFKAGTIDEDAVNARKLVVSMFEGLSEYARSSVHSSSNETEAKKEEISEDESQEGEDYMDDCNQFSYAAMFGLDSAAAASICRRALDAVIDDPSYNSYLSEGVMCCYPEKRALCVPHIRSYVAELSIDQVEKLTMGHLDAAVDIAINTIQMRVDVLRGKRFHLWK